jgi:hypothetical protein
MTAVEYEKWVRYFHINEYPDRWSLNHAAEKYEAYTPKEKHMVGLIAANRYKR